VFSLRKILYFKINTDMYFGLFNLYDLSYKPDGIKFMYL
jgi:hypothetical protein